VDAEDKVAGFRARFEVGECLRDRAGGGLGGSLGVLVVDVLAGGVGVVAVAVAIRLVRAVIVVGTVAVPGVTVFVDALGVKLTTGPPSLSLDLARSEHTLHLVFLVKRDQDTSNDRRASDNGSSNTGGGDSDGNTGRDGGTLPVNQVPRMCRRRVRSARKAHHGRDARDGVGRERGRGPLRRWR